MDILPYSKSKNVYVSNGQRKCKTPGVFEMCDSNQKPLQFEQNTEAGIIREIHGTVKGDKQTRLAMYALLRAADPTIALDQVQDCVQAWTLFDVLSIKDLLFELDRKGGTTYEISVKIR